MSIQAQELRKAIENLMNAKLRDLVRPGGVDRLVAHRVSGIAAYEIRDAEKRLEQAIAELIPAEETATAGGKQRFDFE
jgi:DNA-binding HxlR family transcriptional regulator